MAKLIVTSGDLDAKEFPVSAGSVIGRSPECDVMIPRGWMSRQHARITCKDGCWFVEDLGTRNGTSLNGRRIAKAFLCDGDRIAIGDCELTFQSGEGAGAAVHLDDSATTITGSVAFGDLRERAAEAQDAATVKRLKAHLKALQEVGETACGDLEIEHVLRQILARLLTVYPQAGHAHVILFGLGEGGRDLHLSAAPGDGKAVDAGMSRTLLEIVTAERRAVLAADAEADARMADAQSIVSLGLRSMMCSPLLVRDRLLGAIQVDTTDIAQRFTNDDLLILATVAGQVAFAAENALLHRRAVQQERLAAIGQTVSGVAHCMKNVLNAMKGGAFILDSGVQKQDAEKVRKGWEMVRRNTDFLSDLVMDMLAYCRKERPAPQPTDLGELLKGTLEMVRESAAQKGVEATLCLTGSLPQMVVDAVGVKRAVLNLLTNAVEACPQGGHVQLGAGLDARGGEVQISVKDDGQGMPEDVRRRLFEAFFTTKGNKGTGLGLALVKKVVEEHGGRITVQSEVGKGTTFMIALPVRAPEPEAKGKA